MTRPAPKLCPATIADDQYRWQCSLPEGHRPDRRGVVTHVAHGIGYHGQTEPWVRTWTDPRPLRQRAPEPAGVG